MTARGIGQVLRLAGPLIQVVCLAGLFSGASSWSLRAACYAGFLVGFVLVLVGNILARWPSRRGTDPEEPETSGLLDP
jgi:cation transporter-like permease